MRTFPKYAPLATLSALAVVLLLLAVVLSSPAGANVGDPILGEQVTVTELEAKRIVTGFVETGSDSLQVLCTLNENSPGFGGVRLSGLTVICRHRAVDFDDGNGPRDGVAILVILPGQFRATPTEEIALTLTVFQGGATSYEPVVSCQDQCW